MHGNGLELTLEKTEAVVLTQKKKLNKMVMKFDGIEIKSASSIRYLGIQIDSRMHYVDHAKIVAKRAEQTVNQLAAILPNIRGQE